MKILFLPAAILAFAAVVSISIEAATAQPIRETDEGVFVTLPERVEVHPDGRIEVVTKEVGPIKPGEMMPTMPASVETWTVKPDGTHVSGYPMRPHREESIYPQEILFDEKGYEIMPTFFGPLHNTPRQYGDAMKWRKEHTGWTQNTSQADFPVVVESRRSWLGLDRPQPTARSQKTLKRAGPFDVRFDLVTNTFPANHLSAIQAAFFRVEQRFEMLLSADAGLLRIESRFDSTLPSGAAAGTDVRQITRSYNDATSRLLTAAVADQESGQETALYEQLLGDSKNVKFFPDSDPQPVGTMLAPAVIAPKWGLGAQPLNEATLRIRPMPDVTTNWDYHAKNRVRPGFADFEAAVTHEVIHALGFVSNGDLDFGNSRIWLWDVFRLERDDVGAFADFFEIAALPRMLDPETEAVMVLVLLDMQGIPRVSSGSRMGGDGKQPNHWKATLLLPIGTQYTGIMDPDLELIQAAGKPYLRAADIGAIDQIGWNLNRNSPPQAPVPGVPQLPPNGQQRTPYTPMLSWTNGSGATSRDLYMYEGGTVNADDAYYEVIGVAGTSHVVPPGVLKADTTYLWFVTSINSFDFSWSVERTFTTLPACSGDADGDRDRDFPDITSVLSNFGATYQPAPPGVFPGDANGDGAVNFADTTAVLQSFGIACP